MQNTIKEIIKADNRTMHMFFRLASLGQPKAEPEIK